MLAQAWNLLAGQAGLVSLGTSAAVGVGGYVYVYLANSLHAPVWLGLSAAEVELLHVVEFVPVEPLGETLMPSVQM